jgi:surface-anchored protein
LPQADDPAKPFLGIASEELTPANWNSLTLRLVVASGPAGGHFSLWQSDLFGSPTMKMATGDGISAADTISLSVGGHDHFNYGFTQPGIYNLTFQWDGEHAVDGVVSATGTYSFGVTTVPESSSTALLALGALALFARRRACR